MVSIQGHNACRVLGMWYVPNSYSNSIVVVVRVAVFSPVSEKSLPSLLIITIKKLIKDNQTNIKALTL